MVRLAETVITCSATFCSHFPTFGGTIVPGEIGHFTIGKRPQFTSISARGRCDHWHGRLFHQWRCSMYRVLAVCLLVVAGLFFVGSNAGAQKKGEKPQVGSGSLGSVEVYKGKKGFRYRVKNSENHTIAMPLPQMHWDTKADCLKAIDEVRTILVKTKPVDAKD
jgi:hypothetical protein